ncbi:hypothetical protein [Pseudomonas aeruginosa]|uniref:hypothetical protein n=1 Tax=Pseudomonas aeruginosa TaxID=287 RepID=UPI00104D4308|nr:hypothetical protein [Pseudomonas aeruginosa]
MNTQVVETVATTEAAAVETVATTETPAVMFYGNNVADIENETNATIAGALKEALNQFSHRVATTKQEEKISLEGFTVEEIQAKLAEVMIQKANATRKPEEITLAQSTVSDILKHKAEEIGNLFFEILKEAAVQVKSSKKGSSTTSGSRGRAKGAQTEQEFYALKIDGINGNKPFFSSKSGAATKEVKALFDKIDAAGLKADYQQTIKSGEKEGQLAWNKSKVLQDFGTKIDMTTAEIYEKFDAKAKNVTEEKLGNKMPTLTLKKVEAKKK